MWFDNRIYQKYIGLNIVSLFLKYFYIWRVSLMYIRSAMKSQSDTFLKSDARLTNKQLESRMMVH